MRRLPRLPRAAGVRRAYGRAVRLTRRHLAYFGLRGLAAAGVLAAALLVPPGLPAALLCVASGLLAVLTCLGVNAGGPGESAGARAQDRAYQRVRPPQGEWPPYDAGRGRPVHDASRRRPAHDPARTVDGELAE